MLTITISARTVVLAAVVAVAAVAAFYATDALGSGEAPDQIIQGDTDCDGDVDAVDALQDLRYVAGLPVNQNSPCIAIGSVAAIPGPQGPQGPPGPAGEPGLSLFANVTSDGTIKSGTATGAELIGGDKYEVSFGQDVSDCAAVASIGWNEGGSFAPNALVREVHAGDPDPNTVTVSFYSLPLDDFITTDFHLILAC